MRDRKAIGSCREARFSSGRQVHGRVYAGSEEEMARSKITREMFARRVEGSEVAMSVVDA